MTDHSILHPATPALPFQAPANVVSRVLSTLFVELPRTIALAVAAQQLSEQLYNLDSPGLAALGLQRENVGRYVLERAGMVVEQSK